MKFALRIAPRIAWPETHVPYCGSVSLLIGGRLNFSLSFLVEITLRADHPTWMRNQRARARALSMAGR